MILPCKRNMLFQILLLLFGSNLSAGIHQRFLFSDKYANESGAKCLDGTASGFYFRPAPTENNTHANDWVMFLQGGGVCVLPSDCNDRKKGPLGSSDYWPESKSWQKGVMSEDCHVNPFCNFNLIWVPYCGGDVHTGQLREPNENGFLFAGHLTIEAIIAQFFDSASKRERTVPAFPEVTADLNSGEEFLLSGESAGGIGVFQHADFMTRLLTGIKVSAAPVGGLFFPTNVVLYEQFLINSTFPTFNFLAAEYLGHKFSSFVDESCAAAHPDNTHRCVDVSYALPYITTPSFLAQNLVDSNQIFSQLFCPRSGGKSKEFISFFGKQMVDTLKTLQPSSKPFGLFGPACLAHTGNLCVGDVNTRVNTSHGMVTYKDVFADWYFETGLYPDSWALDACVGVNGTGGGCNTNCPDECDY
eukprot:m.84174 g.84174  ORF g.84174 m.84174 type:complete len:416 (+) comp21178_c0_seq1:20-1267(+)